MYVLHFIVEMLRMLLIILTNAFHYACVPPVARVCLLVRVCASCYACVPSVTRVCSLLRVCAACSCRETDLEEVLALQTRLHNSAGMFLDSTRRVGTVIPAAPPATRRPRTPNTSPHGSPRRGRKSPAQHGDLPWHSRL